MTTTPNGTKTPAKRGRPPLPPGQALTASVTTQFTEPEVDALCAIASKRKVEVRVLVREWVRKLIRDESGTMITR